MKKPVFVLLAAALLLFAGFSSASATAVPWSQPFYEAGVGPFDELGLYMQGDAVDFTGAYDYSPSNWVDIETPNFIMATGNPDATLLYFTLGFTDKIAFTFNFYALLDDVLKEATRVDWTGSNWIFTPIAYNNYQRDVDANPTPEPATMVLLGIGMLGLAGITRKKIKK